MNWISSSALALLSAFALAGCGSGGGGGDDEVIDSRTQEPIAFVSFDNQPAGDVVKDVDLEDYKFTTTGNAVVPSCLYHPGSETLILSFCQAPGQMSSRYQFVDRYIDVKSVKLPNGTCGLAMVDAELGSIVHVYVQNGGVTVLSDPDPATPC